MLSVEVQFTRGMVGPGQLVARLLTLTIEGMCATLTQALHDMRVQLRLRPRQYCLPAAPTQC